MTKCDCCEELQSRIEAIEKAMDEMKSCMVKSVNRIMPDEYGNIQTTYYVTQKDFNELKTKDELVRGASYIVTDG
jgi:hypothetical protein